MAHFVNCHALKVQPTAADVAAIGVPSIRLVENDISFRQDIARAIRQGNGHSFGTEILPISLRIHRDFIDAIAAGVGFTSNGLPSQLHDTDL